MVHSGTTSNLKPRLQLSSFSRHPSGTGLRFDEVRIDRNPDEPGFTAGRPNSIRLIQLIARIGGRGSVDGWLGGVSADDFAARIGEGISATI